MDKRKESWEQEFWNTVDGHIPDAPRHVQLARLESADPIVVNLGGLLYERDKGEVLINHFLIKRSYDDVTLGDAQGGASIQPAVINGNLTFNDPELEAGDLVCVVQLEGKQQLVILCKVV